MIRLPGCSGDVGGDGEWAGCGGAVGVMERGAFRVVFPLAHSVTVIGRTDRTMWQKNQILPSTSCVTVQPF